MSSIRSLTLVICSFFLCGVSYAQNDKLGRVAEFASELGYRLVLTPEESGLGSFSCVGGNLPSAFDNSTPAGKTVCQGTVHDPRIQVLVGWKSADYKKLDVARDVGNSLLALNSMKSGEYTCAGDNTFPKKLNKIDVAATHCYVVANAGPTYWFSILFLYPKSNLGTSQTITVLSSNPLPSDQVALPQELWWIAQRIQ